MTTRIDKREGVLGLSCKQAKGFVEGIYDIMFGYVVVLLI